MLVLGQLFQVHAEENHSKHPFPHHFLAISRAVFFGPLCQISITPCICQQYRDRPSHPPGQPRWRTVRVSCRSATYPVPGWLPSVPQFARPGCGLSGGPTFGSASPASPVCGVTVDQVVFFFEPHPPLLPSTNGMHGARLQSGP